MNASLIEENRELYLFLLTANNPELKAFSHIAEMSKKGCTTFNDTVVAALGPEPEKNVGHYEGLKNHHYSLCKGEIACKVNDAVRLTFLEAYWVFNSEEGITKENGNTYVPSSCAVEITYRVPPNKVDPFVELLEEVFALGDIRQRLEIHDKETASK